MFVQVMCRRLLAVVASTALIVVLVSSASASKAGPSKFPLSSALNAAADVPNEQEEMVSSLIVKPKAEAGAKLASALQAANASGLSTAANVPLTVLRPMSGDAYVIKLDQPMPLSEARAIAARLMYNDPSLEYAEPDQMMHPLATPTDPGYVNQWHYFAPDGANKGGTNLPLVWDFNKGSTSVVAAVLDTGYRQHVDFATFLPGYDFLSDVPGANDGDGRDADARDPGDWVAAGECGLGSPAHNSSWHGTHVAGTIAALMNNGIGGTGVAPNVKLLPVRVLSKCGGSISDIVDGMRWAAGLTVTGVPSNPNPAKVLNMSLGGSGACSPPFQSAVNDVVNAGKVIVAATGNDGAAAVGQPANCTGAIAVTAHAIDGDNANYANVGPVTAISGPGGGCGTLASGCVPFSTPNGLGVYSTLNSGTTVPAQDNYAVYQGTSMATPHVAGVAALMFSVKSTLTPANIKSFLQSSARPHPAGTFCTSSFGTGLCGAGLLDARAALATIPGAPPTVTLTNPSQVVAPNTTVSLSGTATADSGRSIGSYAWTQATGSSVGTITNANQANASFTAPATGTFSFRLTATDSGGLTGTATATVRVNSPPVLTPVAAQTVPAGSTLNFTVGATDVDGDSLIFVSVSLPTGATLSAAGAFSWPNAGPEGNYTLTYFARDNVAANSSQGTVNISVTAPGASPPPAPSSGGGGCTLSRTGNVDSLLPALFLLTFGLLAWRWKQSRSPR